jgi:pimeloyl-ACP methyl ester carboxylesterase
VVGHLLAPARLGRCVPLLWCCFPGGGMTKAYWDLAVPRDLGEYSMARWMAERGDAVLIVDHLGTGESSRPDDGWLLTPGVVAAVNATVVQRVRERLRSPLGALPLVTADTPTVGVGHSAGASLVVHQQAVAHSFTYLALLGFGGGGSMDDHLEQRVLAYAGHQDELHLHLVELAQARYAEARPAMRRGTSQLLVGHPMDPGVHEALVAARTELLALVGMAAMVEGNAARELAALDVPVMVAVGEHDITGPVHHMAQQLPKVPDLTLLVLPGAGHNHSVAPSRTVLWQRLRTWAHSLTT